MESKESAQAQQHLETNKNSNLYVYSAAPAVPRQTTPQYTHTEASSLCVILLDCMSRCAAWEPSAKGVMDPNFEVRAGSRGHMACTEQYVSHALFSSCIVMEGSSMTIDMPSVSTYGDMARVTCSPTHSSQLQVQQLVSASCQSHRWKLMQSGPLQAHPFHDFSGWRSSSAQSLRFGCEN